MNVLGLFAVANVAGYLLWASRDRLPIWKAALLLVLVSGVTGAAVLHVVNAAGLWQTVQMEPWVYSIKTSYVILVSMHSAALLWCLGPMRRWTT